MTLKMGLTVRGLGLRCKQWSFSVTARCVWLSHTRLDAITRCESKLKDFRFTKLDLEIAFYVTQFTLNDRL